MHPSSEFARLFSSVHQPVIGTDGERVVFANPTAKTAAGFDPTGRNAAEIIPQEILESAADNFVCAASIFNRKASISVVRDRGVTILFLEFICVRKSSFNLTRNMIGNLRSCVMGLKMSADRCFSMLEEGKTPEEKYSSVFYHYYYSLLRSLVHIDSADLLERGEILFSPVPTDLVKLCTELTDTISLLCSKTGVGVSFVSEEKSLIAVVDPLRIEQLLLNLFSNSLQYTSAGNNIVLSLSRSGNRIILSLDDDGEGISQETLSNIFSLPDDARDQDPSRTGSGLGLYISFGIAQLHNGVLLIESRVDAGTRVRVMLPADEDPSPKFSSPETSYNSSCPQPVLTELSCVLPSSCFGPKFED